MENSTEGSLLHPNIAEFYKLNSDLKPAQQSTCCVDKDGTFAWENLRTLLEIDGECGSYDQTKPTTYNEYLSHFRVLQPVFHQCKAAITPSLLSDKHWLAQLHWLGHETQVLSVLQSHIRPPCSTTAVENALLLTSLIENGLANVFYTVTSKSPPHLLRDLLDTQELRDLLGICPIMFLKILMGSPNSVNLRNVVWHGFPLPGEIPLSYPATLLIVAASVSKLLVEKQIQMQRRLQVKDYSRFIQKIKSSPIDLELLNDVPNIVKAIEVSKWTGKSGHRAFWLQALEHYQDARYWQLIILVLPQIELVLRRMYGEANNFDITAKLDEYYITMDSIFELNDNRLLTGYLSKETLHLLYDIFISPYGMRIRDKVSHGEVDLNCIDKDLSAVLLYAGMNLITSNEGFPVTGYVSLFHLNSLAYECIVASRRCVLELMDLRTPSCYEIEFEWNRSSIAALQTLEIIRPLSIFNRPKKEPEVVGILMKTAQLIIQICENYRASFVDRFRMLISHELRSRARKTLNRMVETMAIIAATMGDMVESLADVSNLLQMDGHEWFENRFSSTQRFLKQTLTIAENLVRYSDKDSNEWVNALECCSKFKEVKQFLTS